MICCLNGKFLDEKDAKISILDNGFMYGDAFFDTMKSQNNSIVELENHLKRIYKTAKILHIKLPAEKRLADWINKTPKINELSDARIRITISRGVNGRNFFTSKNPTIAITCTSFTIDEKIVKNGVSVLTVKFQRPWPEIKSTNLMTMIRAYYEILPKKIHEAILIDDLNYVTEGCTSNVFIIKKGIFFTPKDKVLSGVTRDRIILLCKKNKLKVQMKNFKKSALLDADEVFLVNSTNEVVPVIKVDNKKIGTGKVGPATKKLIKIYEKFLTLSMLTASPFSKK